MVIKSEKKPRGRAGGGSRAGIPGRIIEAALKLAVDEGWGNVSLAQVAAKAGLSLAQVHGAFTSKAAIVGGFFGAIDEKVLAGGGGEGEGVRDRLFDLIMRRFDALNPHKEAVAAIQRGLCADPMSCLCAARDFMGSMSWTLEAAGVSSSGIMGRVHTRGLALIYLNVFRVWLGDDSPDMARTMAALDRGLGRAEQAMILCRCAGRGAEAGETAPEEATAAG